MEGEMQRFMKVWFTVFVSLTYSYFISKLISKGFIRLFTLLPIIVIFTFLPLTLSSIVFNAPTGFFIGWIANFNLLLLAFDQGPLSSTNNNISLPLFITLAWLPIQIKQNPPPKSKIKPNPSLEINIKQNPSLEITKSSQVSSSSSNVIKPPKSPLYYAIKSLLLAILLHVYEYKSYFHPTFILFLYCFHTFLALEIFLALVGFLARFLIGLELEPHFNDPYLSTSLQDFWGRRWNLMVSGLLRDTVYKPVRFICTHIFGIKLARILALLATFTVSGVMHELIFFYIGRIRPTWEAMWFFALHGVCLAVEIELKKAFTGKCRLHPLVSRPLTIGFVMVTGFWLYFPVFGRVGMDVKMNEAIATLGQVIKSGLQSSWVHVDVVG